MGAAPETTSASCPICGKPRMEKYRPFCSRRCADVDLHRWLTGAYAVPAVEDDEAPDDEGGDSPPTAPQR
jgi:uncharacterized protein